MALIRPKTYLYGNKVLLVDDLIASGDPQTDSRESFLYNSNLDSDDVYFADAYESALDVLENNPEINLVFVDIRIPKKSEDLSDFNPEDPSQGWGSTLLKEIAKRYKKRDLEIIIITAYTLEDLSEPSIANLGRKYCEKPLNYDEIVKEIQLIVKEKWEHEFDYTFLDAESSSFVLERTTEIKKLVKRTIEDTIKIGNYLIEVKEKLPFGKFLDWLATEFSWTSRTATNLMRVAEEFNLETVSDLDIAVSALYTLAASSTSPQARTEAIARAEKGEKITKAKARQIKNKYKKQAPIQSKHLPKSEESDTKQEKYSSPVNETNSNQEKERIPHQILSINQNNILNSFWQLGEKHYLFCGEPSNKLFLSKLPQPTIILNFPPDGSWQKIPFLESSECMVFIHNFASLKLEELERRVDNIIQGLTEDQDNVIFSYLHDPALFFLADKLDCRCFIAEPNLKLCDNLIKLWKEKGNILQRLS